VARLLQPHAVRKAKGQDQGQGRAKGQARPSHSQKRQAERVKSRKFFESFKKNLLTQFFRILIPAPSRPSKQGRDFVFSKEDFVFRKSDFVFLTERKSSWGGLQDWGGI
jgi:hypothetical protein